MAVNLNSQVMIENFCYDDDDDGVILAFYFDITYIKSTLE